MNDISVANEMSYSKLHKQNYFKLFLELYQYLPKAGLLCSAPVGGQGQENIDYIFNNLECLICIL